jgi:hypothetical protein
MAKVIIENFLILVKSYVLGRTFSTVQRCRESSKKLRRRPLPPFPEAFCEWNYPFLDAAIDNSPRRDYIAMASADSTPFLQDH